MANSLRNYRREITDLLITMFSDIVAADGFNNTIRTVARWRTTKFDPAECPALVIRDLSNEKKIDAGLSAMRQNRLLIQVEVVVADQDSQVIEQIDSYIPDIEKILRDNEELDDGDDLDPKKLAWYIEPIDDTIVADQKTKAIAGLTYRFYVVYASDTFGD